MFLFLLPHIFFDHYERIGNIEQAFLITSIAMTILSVVRFISFLKMERIDNNNKNAADFREILANTIGKRDCRKVILLQVLWNVSKLTCYGFLRVYKTNDLMFSVSVIQIINIAASIIRVLCSRLLGKYTDKHTYAKGFRLGLIILAVGYVSLCFCTPKTRWLIIVYSVLEAISLAGIEANNLNVVYDYSDSKYFVEASAIKNSIGGIIGFLIAIPAGKLLAYVQESGNTFLGFHLYGQQILAAAALFITIITILYIIFS